MKLFCFQAVENKKFFIIKDLYKFSNLLAAYNTILCKFYNNSKVI